MTRRRIFSGLAAMVAIFVIGSIIGGVWDDDDTAGAITATLWVISVVGAVLLLVMLAVVTARDRRAT